MSVLTRHLNRLRYTYSILRLSDKHDCRHLSNILSQLNLDDLKRLSYDTKDKHETIVVEHLKENEYAHNVFVKSCKYKNNVTPQIKTYAYITNEETLELLKSNWAAMNDSELIFGMKRLIYNLHYSSSIIESFEYKNVFDELHLRLSKLNDKDLVRILQLLVPLRQQFNDCDLEQDHFTQLSEECVKRFKDVYANDMLQICDMLYELNSANKCNYIWHALKKLGSKPHKLAPYQLIQVFFFLNVCRKVPINIYELEYYLEQYIEDLSINEIAITALGFFKTRTPIRSNKLLRQIMLKTISNMELIDNLAVAAIFKLIRYSMKLQELPVFEKLITTLIPYEHRFTLTTLSHVAHACARVTLYNKMFMDKLIERTNNEVKHARLKDLEKLLFIFTCFNIDSSNKVYSNIVEELRTTWNTSRAYEITEFPFTASRLIGYMATVNIYPTDLIERIMSRQFLHKAFSGNNSKITQEYCTLDYGLQIEVPEYSGNFLKPELRQFLMKKYFLDCKTAQSSRTNIQLTKVLQTCQDIFYDTSYITVTQVLPHYTLPDVILCLNENNELMPTKQLLSEFKLGEIKRINENAKNGRWVALVMASFGLLIKDTSLPIGYLAAKIRQLSKIGYEPIIVTHLKWNNYSQQERCDYIKELLFENNKK